MSDGRTNQLLKLSINIFRRTNQNGSYIGRIGRKLLSRL